MCMLCNHDSDNSGNAIPRDDEGMSTAAPSAKAVAAATHGTSAAWAGSYECCGPCGRKRLVAQEFSKKQIEKKQKDESAKVTCKQCVEAAAAEERNQAAARQAERQKSQPATAIDISDGAAPAPQLHACATCAKELSADAFNRTQLSKGAGKQRCRACVEKAEATSASESTEKKEAAIEEARKALQKAEVSGSAVEKLKAASQLSALEGEKVTGLKPVILGKGGRGRGGGSWRGRSGKGK